MNDYAYISLAPCGCWRAICSDDPQCRDLLGKFLIREAKKGGRIERVSGDSFRAGTFTPISKCPHKAEQLALGGAR